MIESKGIKDCNGCQACIVACKKNCIKTQIREDGSKNPVVNMDGCDKCNACRLYCPLYFPVDLPKFPEYYKDNGDVFGRDMPPIYRETMRNVKAGQHTEFVGTLCQIAALKSLLGDKLPDKLMIAPVVCDMTNPKAEACKNCHFYKKK